MNKWNEQEEVFLNGLGERIRLIRQERKMTQKELGYLTDMEDANLNRIEKGKTNPTALTLRKICLALDITISDLFSNAENNV